MVRARNSEIPVNPAYHLLLSWFIWCPDGPTGGQGSPFSVALTCPIVCWAYLFAHQDAPAALGSAGSPGKSFLLVEDGIQAPDLASKCIHCFWDGTALQHIWQTELGICALCPENHINFSVYIFKNHVFILTHPVPIQHHRTHPNFALGVFVAPVPNGKIWIPLLNSRIYKKPFQNC